MPFDPDIPQENTDLDAAQMRAQLIALKALIDAAAPIGSMQAWLKNFPGVPPLSDGWVECNGQVLNDPASPMNGQALPNPNGQQRFLRGAASSGGTGGAGTHSHTFTGITDVRNDSQGAFGFGTNTPVTDDASSLPDYYEVVWIVKVR